VAFWVRAQMQAAGAFTSAPGVTHPLIANPVKYGCSADHEPRARAPGLGDHTTQVLGRLVAAGLLEAPAAAVGAAVPAAGGPEMARAIADAQEAAAAAAVGGGGAE
jgi:hypothetical protein